MIALDTNILLYAHAGSAPEGRTARAALDRAFAPADVDLGEDNGVEGSREEFERLYGGEAYAALKRKYDPQGAFPTLYEKCVLRR